MTEKTTDIRDNVLLIHAGYVSRPKGTTEDQFAAISPYREGGLVMRLLRELWFRGHLPGQTWWYNKEVLDFRGKYLLVSDPLVTPHYIKWLQKHNRWTIKLLYGNMVGNARHFAPNRFPPEIEKWTFDERDSRKYGLHCTTTSGYDPSCVCEKQEPEYDVLFVGSDKGRAEFLFRLERELHAIGLRTFFRVVGDTRFTRKKDPRYGPPISYDEICHLVAKSRSILNVVMPHQEGHTVRDSEAIWNDVKLITTNRKVTERTYYRPENILVIEEQTATAEQIRDFLAIPLVPYPESEKQKRRNSSFVREIIGE